MFYSRKKINSSSETYGDLLNSCCYPESFQIWTFSFEIFSKTYHDICSGASLVIVFPYSENFDLVDLLEFKKFILKISFSFYLHLSFIFILQWWENSVIQQVLGVTGTEKGQTCGRVWAGYSHGYLILNINIL